MCLAHAIPLRAVCHAFPDDAYATDQFFVALISVAVALPVDIFLNRAFEIANEGELPETWLEAPPGKWRKVLGDDCHNGWRLADPAAPVRDVVLWLVHERNEGFIATALRLVNWLWSHFRAHPEPEEFAAEHEPGGVDDQASEASKSSSASAAAGEALAKRLYASAGLLGIYVVWAIFSWFIFVSSHPRASVACAALADSHPVTDLRHANLQAAGPGGRAGVCKGAPLTNSAPFVSQPAHSVTLHRLAHYSAYSSHSFAVARPGTDVGRWVRHGQCK